MPSLEIRSNLADAYADVYTPAALNALDAVAPHDRQGYLRDLRGLIAQAAQKLPSQADFIARHCAAAT